jgi:protein gp37
VFGVMACVDRHTFQVLTKRSQRMREWFSWIAHDPDWCRIALHQHTGLAGMRPWEWPLKNVWLGVSAEDQQRANERIPDLLATPAAVRFVSAEPLIGPIDLSRVRPDPVPIDALTGRWSVPARDGSTQEPRLHWIIVGGESGPGARPCAMEWIERIVEQCRAAGVACFVKQLGKRVTGRDCEHGRRGESCGFVDRKGGDPAEWPADLRVREFPR